MEKTRKHEKGTRIPYSGGAWHLGGKKTCTSNIILDSQLVRYHSLTLKLPEKKNPDSQGSP